MRVKAEDTSEVEALRRQVEALQHEGKALREKMEDTERPQLHEQRRLKEEQEAQERQDYLAREREAQRRLELQREKEARQERLLREQESRRYERPPVLPDPNPPRPPGTGDAALWSPRDREEAYWAEEERRRGCERTRDWLLDPSKE